MMTSSSELFFEELIHFLFYTSPDYSYFPYFIDNDKKNNKQILSNPIYLEYGYPFLYRHYPHNKADYISTRKMIMMILITKYLHTLYNEDKVILSKKGLEMVHFTESRILSEKPCRKRKNYNIEKIAYVMFQGTLHKRKKYRQISVQIKNFVKKMIIDSSSSKLN